MTSAEMKKFLTDVLIKKGMYAFEAEVVADRLIDADQLGMPAQGCASLVSCVKSIDLGDIDPRAIAIPKNETSATCFFNANEGMGHVAATKGMQSAIKKAQEHGIGIVLIGNSQSLGSPLIYARIAAQQGMIGVCLTSTAEKIAEALQHSSTAVLGRLPFAYAAPLGDQLIGFEMAFTATHGREQLLPPELTVPFGLLHTLLTCCLTGERIPPEKNRGPLHERTEHFLLAINPASFAGLEAFCKKGTALAAYLQEHQLPLTSQTLSPEAELSLSEETLAELKKIAEKEKIPWPSREA